MIYCDIYHVRLVLAHLHETASLGGFLRRLRPWNIAEVIHIKLRVAICSTAPLWRSVKLCTSLVNYWWFSPSHRDNQKLKLISPPPSQDEQCSSWVHPYGSSSVPFHSLPDTTTSTTATAYWEPVDCTNTTTNREIISSFYLMEPQFLLCTSLNVSTVKQDNWSVYFFVCDQKSTPTEAYESKYNIYYFSAAIC